VSITAELVASRSRSAGASVRASSLKDGTGPIHAGSHHTGPLHAVTTQNLNTPQHQETPWT
jgi:xanthine dehydrogenase accessory factor